jgi:hypothetical protein
MRDSWRKINNACNEETERNKRRGWEGWGGLNPDERVWVVRHLTHPMVRATRLVSGLEIINKVRN